MGLCHLIYASAATRAFTTEELSALLAKARDRNADLGITGMLLYADRTFFQVLEGDPDAVDRIFATISKDPRHNQVVTIIREPIARRAFGEWTMGFAHTNAEELGRVTGMNDFFSSAACLTTLDSGRAKKVLAAFRQGRWRVRTTVIPVMDPGATEVAGVGKVSFAYQPIVDADRGAVVAYEAQVRGPNNEPAAVAYRTLSDQEWSRFDTDCRGIAIEKALRLGLRGDLHLRFMALSADDARAAIGKTIEVAAREHIEPQRLILEVDQDRLIGDSVVVARAIEEYRALGLRTSIDHFGTGRASLALLEVYRPDMVSLAPNLVRDIDSHGPRQAIVRGVAQTCGDLGIDVVAKHIETAAEYAWLRAEGLTLFQGDLLAPPGFDELPAVRIPD